MLLCDPFAVHTVTQTVVNELHQLCENEQLPRDSAQLMLLLRLLQFGLNAQKMIHCQDFSEKEMVCFESMIGVMYQVSN
jgi:negative elongation factor B